MLRASARQFTGTAMFTLQSLPCRCSRLQPLPERGLQRRPTLSLGAPQKRFLGVVRGAHVQTRMQVLQCMLILLDLLVQTLITSLCAGVYVAG